jgi:uncharacterized membrane protein
MTSHLDLMSSSGLTVVAVFWTRHSSRIGRPRMSASFVALGVSTGVVVIAVAVAVVLVVLLVTMSMRGRQMRGAEQRGEARREVDEAREAGRAEGERDIAPQGREDLGGDR